MIRSTSSGCSATVAGASAFSTNRRSATAGSSVAASAMRVSVCCGIGCAFGPPGVVQASTSRSTRSGYRERELLRDHAAEARADDVRALDAGLVEHLDRVGGHLGGRVRAGRRVALADAAVVEEDHVEPLGEARAARAPSPSARSRARGSGAAARRSRAAPRRSARSRRGLLGQRLAARAMPRSRVGRLASPPGTKKTSRMNSVPRRNSGSESGHRAARPGDPARGSSPTSAPSRWSSERVEEAADHRAVACPGAAEHDHHEQREREVRGRHLGRRAADQEQPDDAAEAARNAASTKASSLNGIRAQPDHLDPGLVLADRAPDVPGRRARSPSRTTTNTTHRVAEREPVEVLRVEDADEEVGDVRRSSSPMPSSPPVSRRVLLDEHGPRLRERERHHRERDPRRRAG